ENDLGGTQQRQVRYWPQTNNNYTGGDSALAAITLDYVFIGGDVQPRQYDFPDLSTPRFNSWAPVGQYEWVNNHIGRFDVIANEYITNESFFGETDWVLTFATRRYGVEGRNVDAVWGPTGVQVEGVLSPFQIGTSTDDTSLADDTITTSVL